MLTVVERILQVNVLARGKISMWLEVVAPGLIERLAARAIERGK